MSNSGASKTGIVSTGLPAHRAATRINIALRYGKILRAREQAGEPRRAGRRAPASRPASPGEQVRADEWTCYDGLNARARAAVEDEDLSQGPVEMEPGPAPASPLNPS